VGLGNATRTSRRSCRRRRRQDRRLVL